MKLERPSADLSKKGSVEGSLASASLWARTRATGSTGEEEEERTRTAEESCESVATPVSIGDDGLQSRARSPTDRSWDVKHPPFAVLRPPPEVVVAAVMALMEERIPSPSSSEEAVDEEKDAVRSVRRHSVASNEDGGG